MRWQQCKPSQESKHNWVQAMLYSSFIEKLESNRSDGRVLSLQWLLHTSTQAVIAGEDLKA